MLTVALQSTGIGCVKSHVETETAASRSSHTFLDVQIPELEKAEASLDSYRRILMRLAVDHPERIRLRDRLTEVFVKKFRDTPENKSEERFNIFSQALDFHSGSDFIPGGLCPELGTMAMWCVEAFEPRGYEGRVIAGLAVLMLIHPDDWKSKERMNYILNWSVKARSAMVDEVEKINALVDLYEELADLIPVKWVIERLDSLYLERYEVVSLKLDSLNRDESEGRFNLRLFHTVSLYEAQSRMSLDIILLHLKTGDMATALDLLDDFSGMPGVPEEHVEVLRGLVENDRSADAYYKLAGIVGRLNPHAGLKLCLQSESLDREDSRYPLCSARFFEKTEDLWGAWEEYRIALETSPGDIDILLEAMDLLRKALIIAQQENEPSKPLEFFSEADYLLDTVRRLSAGPEKGSSSAEGEKAASPEDTIAGEDTEDLETGVYLLLNVMGQLAFDAGEIEIAIEYLDKSLQTRKNIDALVLLGLISGFRGKVDKALKYYTEALEMASDEGLLTRIWNRAHILEKMGDVHLASGGERRADELYKSALREWERLSSMLLKMPSARLKSYQEVELLLRQGVLLDRLGRGDLSMRSFRLAVRLMPDRRATYALLISLFTTEGKLAEAAEIYQLAYHHDDIPMMWKIYYSLWIRGLARRLSSDNYELASRYLEDVTGDDWTSYLAEYAAGKIEYEELLKRAGNKGEKAEAQFYRGLDLLAADRRDEARRLFEQVIDSGMMGFFEYQMAHSLLRREFR